MSTYTALLASADPPTVLAATRDLLVGIVPLVLGIGIVAALILAVVYGQRLRTRGDQRRSSSAPPHAGPEVTEDREQIDSQDVPRDGRRRMPYEIGTQSTTGRRLSGRPPRWRPGGSGGFGSGGPGHTA